jgi:hypothetical protein
MSIEFFVSTDSELNAINNFDELFELLFQYNLNASGANDFKTVRDISNFFLKNEIYVPTEIVKTYHGVALDINFTVNVYKFDKVFTEEVAKIERDKIDNLEAVEYWQSRGYFEMGTWNAIYGLHNLCIYAVEDNKDIYIYEEIDASVLEK